MTRHISPNLSLPNYGVDAPGVVRNFLAGAAAAAVAAVLIFFKAQNPWALLAAPAAFASLCLAGLGISMLLYSFVGKQRLRDHLLRQRTWKGGEIVLDIGSGRGLMAIGAAHRAPHGRVLALDIWSLKDLSGNNPDSLRTNIAAERVGNVIEIVDGNAVHLELPDASVDVVVSVFCLHNIEPDEDRKKALKEIVRVLKPGGSAMIADFPGVAAYVPVLNESGLTVNGPHRAECIALGIAGFLVAAKPA